MNVGQIVHKLRKDGKMTLAELSKKSGVALATLSRMENGRMTGTLDSHINICRALEISLPDLYKDLSVSKKAVELHSRKRVAQDVFVHNRRSSSEMLASNAINKKMMPILIRADQHIKKRPRVAWKSLSMSWRAGLKLILARRSIIWQRAIHYILNRPFLTY